MKKINWKPVLNRAGFTIGLAGVVFVTVKLWHYSNQIHFSGMSFFSVCSLIFLAFAYAFANLLMATGWRSVMLHLNVKTEKKWAIRTYGISQIAKYVPGNIFQFAGRQVIGQAAELPAGALARSVVWELGLLAFTGSFFSVLVLPLFWAKISYPAALLLFLIVISLVVWVIYKWIGKYAAAAMRQYVIFLIIAGIIFYGVMTLVTRVMLSINYIFIGITGTYVVAWLAGLVTPGAPAGIGVREVVFLSLLNSVIPGDELLKLIILARFVTVGGDVLFYIFALLLRLTNRQKG